MLGLSLAIQLLTHLDFKGGRGKDLQKGFRGEVDNRLEGLIRPRYYT